MCDCLVCLDQSEALIFLVRMGKIQTKLMNYICRSLSLSLIPLLYVFFCCRFTFDFHSSLTKIEKWKFFNFPKMVSQLTVSNDSQLDWQFAGGYITFLSAIKCKETSLSIRKYSIHILFSNFNIWMLTFSIVTICIELYDNENWMAFTFQLN